MRTRRISLESCVQIAHVTCLRGNPRLRPAWGFRVCRRRLVSNGRTSMLGQGRRARHLGNDHAQIQDFLSSSTAHHQQTHAHPHKITISIALARVSYHIVPWRVCAHVWMKEIVSSCERIVVAACSAACSRPLVAPRAAQPRRAMYVCWGGVSRHFLAEPTLGYHPFLFLASVRNGFRRFGPPGWIGWWPALSSPTQPLAEAAAP